MRFIYSFVILLILSGCSQENNLEKPNDVVGIPAEFPGGAEALTEFINEEMRNPLQLGDESCVVNLSFMVNEQGVIGDVKVELGCYEMLDKEAVRLVRSMPNWKPKTINDKPVASRCRLPIPFIAYPD